VVVLTALAEEKAAVVAALAGTTDFEVIREVRDDVHVALIGALRIAVTSLLGMGNVGASAAAREVIEAWQPEFLVLVGIAAGIRGQGSDLRLGDILVADQVVGFELAKLTPDGPQRRYQSFRPHFDLLAAAQSVAASGWTPAMAAPPPDGRAGSGRRRHHRRCVRPGRPVRRRRRSRWRAAAAASLGTSGR